jgi:hypothetical protein
MEKALIQVLTGVSFLTAIMSRVLLLLLLPDSMRLRSLDKTAKLEGHSHG